MAYVYRHRAAMVAALLTRKENKMALPISKQIDFMVDAERDAWVTDHGDTAELMRAELAILDQIKKTCETKITAMRELAIQEGLAAKRIDPNFKPSELAPTKEMYIELHGQAAFDKVKRLSQPQPKFTWIV